MAEVGIRSLLVVGIDVVSLAVSARRAGYRIYAVDYFGDQDLKHVCRESRSIIEQKIGKTCGRLDIDFSPKALLRLTKDLLKRVEIDAALLSSGLDDFPDVLSELNDMIPILGNPPNVIQKVRDKMEFFRELKRLGIPCPETVIAEDFEEARKKSKDIGYPVVVKPLSGFGGAGVRKAQSSQDLEQAFRDVCFFYEKVLVQEHISGIPASASLISSIKGVVTLTLNEQLLGMHEVGQREPFGYCGNVVPLSVAKVITNKCKGIIERIIPHFGLIGSNGIDLVISREGIPYIIEVNPRFQGTLECVERVLKINLAEAHVKACIQGILPRITKKPSIFCVRLILFAPQRSVVPNLSTLKEIRDIPMPGILVEKGEPVCSVIVEGSNRDSSLRKARRTAELIYKLLQPHD